ncbi:hypothetical protein KDW57_23175 [Burkholderia multivorans]|uniref:hypothetical protein n=1 Tax=Burkholderia multivorans TaxID=87883 RepID=UPI001B8FB771|nr:hypothetical protein [Burkholderia multivorans]MBR8021207.1 hypothetical protein [Burkholderia multivorans]HEF4732701.1 hypothetical protein [Burkholderia multivorans]
MRPTPTRLPDDVLAPACATLGAGSPEQALSNPAVRAAIQAAVRAQLNPNPRARNAAPQRTTHPTPATRGNAVDFDIKRRAANDCDED